MNRSVGDGFDLVHEIGRMQATTHDGERNRALDWPSVNQKNSKHSSDGTQKSRAGPDNDCSFQTNS